MGVQLAFGNTGKTNAAVGSTLARRTPTRRHVKLSLLHVKLCSDALCKVPSPPAVGRTKLFCCQALEAMGSAAGDMLGFIVLLIGDE